MIVLPCAIAALVQRAPPLSPTQRPISHSALHSCRTSMCGEIRDISSFLQQVRAAKAALVRGLEEESGDISEDMFAVIKGLSSISPTGPNPSEDIDLWSGVNTPLPLLPLLPEPAKHGCVFSLRLQATSSFVVHSLDPSYRRASAPST